MKMLPGLMVRAKRVSYAHHPTLDGQHHPVDSFHVCSRLIPAVCSRLDNDQGGPVNASQIMATYIYKYGIKSFKLGYGSAVAIVLFAITLVFSLGYQRMIMRQDYGDLTCRRLSCRAETFSLKRME